MNLNKEYKAVTHCIFDMDGLLLDTESLYTEVVQKILNPFKKEYTWEIKSKLMGVHAKEASKLIVELFNLPMSPEEFDKIYGKLTTEVMGDANLMPGVQRLIEHLHSNKIPICVATSSSQDMVEIKTKKHKDLFDLFDHKVCGGSDPEVKRGKPSPDIFFVAAERFPDKPKPECCLVFEDSPNGVEAAIAAGMQVVMVPDPRVSESDRSKATLVVDSLNDFKPECFGLPPFKN